MSILCSSPSSTNGILVSKIAARHALSFLYPHEAIQSPLFRHQRPLKRQNPLHIVPGVGLEGWFFSSLAIASSCRNHRPRAPNTCNFLTSQRPGDSTRQRNSYSTPYRRQQHTAALVAERHEPPNRSKEELLALVDQYREQPFTDQLPELDLPQLHYSGNGPHLTVSDKEEDEWPPPHNEWPASPETEEKLRLLREALRDFLKDPEETYQLYRQLPGPRAPYLDARTRHLLLRHLAVVEKKDEHSMIRYFSVVDDMKRTAIPLTVAEWTSALSFAASYATRSSEVEVEAALHMWREMEHVAGVKGSDATFNVLYDVACKAGKFTLAEMIYKEMHARGFQFTRFHHVSQIFECGLRGDGDGARAAYKTLVEAGEMVDTVVLNAVLSALTRSHEAYAAESVYERMKGMYMEDTGYPPPPVRKYKAKRQINLALMKMARVAKRDPSMREELQRKCVMAPDIQTYRILVTYFAVKAGELDKAAKLLDEMKYFNIPLHGALFLALFKGFASHGGIRYSQWTEERLESVFKALMKALDDGVEDLYISRWLVIWALNAFAKCSGKSRTVEVWEQFRDRWHPGEAELDHVLGNLRHVLQGEDMAEKRRDSDWVLGPL